MNLRNLKLLLMVVFLDAGSALAADNQEEAKQAYERGDYRKAREMLLLPATQGDAQAQELLGFMHAFGPQMYPGVAHDRKAAALWLDLAARNGRPVARYIYCAMLQKETPRRAPIYCFDHVGESGKAPARPAGIIH